MLNACQFSAAKSRAEAKMLQQLVYKDDKLQDFGRFKKEASEVTDIFQETWLRTEYDTSTKQAVAGELFTSMRADSDLYPYWQYLGTTSDNPREEHEELVGNIYKIGDVEGDMVFPPNGFNCNCSSEQLDNPGEKEVTKGSDSLEHVDPQFRFNPADQGILPKESHSYFQALPNANDADYKMFGLDKMKDAEGLKAKGLHLLVKSYHDWQSKYNAKGTDIVFQNKETLTNIVFNHTSFQVIQNHPGDVDKLPEALISPQEIWQTWGDKKQMIVNRVYIKDGYCVSTRDGIVNDAWSGEVNKYRVGVPA